MKTINVIQLVRVGIRRINCLPKKRFEDIKAASKECELAYYASEKVLTITRCPFCNGYHLTSRRK
jgi:hypothetical protein